MKKAVLICITVIILVKKEFPGSVMPPGIAYCFITFALNILLRTLATA